MAEPHATFDFRQPCRLPIPIETRLMHWLVDASNLIRDKWASYLPFEITMSPAPPETTHPAAYELEPNLQVNLIRFEGYSETTLMAFPAAFCLSIAEGLVGNVLEEAPDPRALTAIERAMVEVIVQLIIDALNESAINCGLPQCELGAPVELPHLLRLFPGIDELVAVRIKLKLSFGEYFCVWFWPEELAHKFFPEDPQADAQSADPEELGHVAKRIPFDVSVRLGAAQVDVTELSQLAVGDVIVLEQRVSEPLEGYVAEQKLFQAWPGIRGKNRAIQIDKVMDV